MSKYKKNYTNVLIDKLVNLRKTLIFLKKCANMGLYITIISSITLVITNIIIQKLYIMYISFGLAILAIIMYFIKLKIDKVMPDLNKIINLVSEKNVTSK